MSEDQDLETAVVETESSGDEAGEDKKSEKDKKSDKTKIRFESNLARDEAVSYFKAIVSGLEEGKVNFRQGEESLTLHPADQVAVEVKASKKGDKAKITFELAWRDQDPEVTLSIVPGGSDE